MSPARRAALSLIGAGVLLAVMAGGVLAGPPYPEPIEGVAVYDPAGALSPEVEAQLESRIDRIETRSSAEIAVYVELDPGLDNDQAGSNAAALMDQWGVGRGGFDDGLVIYVGLDESLQHGQAILYGGSGFDAVYANQDRRQEIFDEVMVPRLRAGDVGGAIVAGLERIDPLVTADGRERLDRARQLNAILGLVVAPIALLGTLGVAWLAWRRGGRDPDFLDSESILIAGPPAEMTPPLATVVQHGRAGQEAVTTALVELATRGKLRFVALDEEAGGGSHGPSIELLDADTGALAEPGPMLVAELGSLAGSDGAIEADDLAKLHERIGPYRSALEQRAVRLGWFREPPGRAIGRWSLVAVLELVAGVIIGVIGIAVPVSGLLFVAGGLGIGALATFGFAQAMPQRTPNGARIDGMLKAYRRTLKLTMEQARSMEQVVAEPTIRSLADTPDKAVMWGIALGLHDEVSKVLERSLADRSERVATGPAYYPLWLGSSGGSVDGPGGGGSIFSGSAIPDVGGMFSALGSIGTAPASSGSGGGGFSGGSSGGGSSAGGGF